jgi:Kef-type K+ transport system membrane component KefB
LGLITYTDFIRSLAHLGAVVLLFVIGLEFHLKDILSARNGVIAGIGVIIPWIGGYWLSLLFGFDIPSAIFIGTALTATSIAITANVLKELGKLQTEAAKAIIGAAVIDDVLSLLVLAISSDVVSGTFSVGGIAIVALKAIAFIVIAGAFGLLVVSRFFERLDTTAFVEKYPEFIFIFVMMMVFLYAMLADAVGLSAIVGAFYCRCLICWSPSEPEQELKRGSGLPPDHLCINILCLTGHSCRLPRPDHGDCGIPVRSDHRCYFYEGYRLRYTSQTCRTVH